MALQSKCKMCGDDFTPKELRDHICKDCQEWQDSFGSRDAQALSDWTAKLTRDAEKLFFSAIMTQDTIDFLEQRAESRKITTGQVIEEMVNRERGLADA